MELRRGSKKRQIYRIKVVEDEEECCIGLQKKAWAGNKSTTLTVRGVTYNQGEQATRKDHRTKTISFSL